MTQEAFQAFKAFDFDETEVYLWVFKRTSKFTARHVTADPALQTALRNFAKAGQARVVEQVPYSHLAQTNENSCLSVSIGDTSFGLVKEVVDQPEPENHVTEEKELLNSTGYLVKFVKGDEVLYAMRRSSSNWKTSYSKKNKLNVFFKNGMLSAAEEREFTLDPNFDMFVLGDNIWVTNKPGFESILQYKTPYVDAFAQLRELPEFVAIFTDMSPLVEHVGSNTVHLRRMAVIQERSIYQDPVFLASVKAVALKRGLGIQFDDEGKIVPTAESAGLIMQILLDHVLVSEVTQHMYSVISDAVRMDG